MPTRLLLPMRIGSCPCEPARALRPTPYFSPRLISPVICPLWFFLLMSGRVGLSIPPHLSSPMSPHPRVCLYFRVFDYWRRALALDNGGRSPTRRARAALCPAAALCVFPSYIVRAAPVCCRVGLCALSAVRCRLGLAPARLHLHASAPIPDGCLARLRRVVCALSHIARADLGPRRLAKARALPLHRVLCGACVALGLLSALILRLSGLRPAHCNVRSGSLPLRGRPPGPCRSR